VILESLRRELPVRKIPKRSEPFRGFGDSDTGDLKGKGVREPKPINPFSTFRDPRVREARSRET
jgi:hypothetical protein